MAEGETVGRWSLLAGELRVPSGGRGATIEGSRGVQPTEPRRLSAALIRHRNEQPQPRKRGVSEGERAGNGDAEEAREAAPAVVASLLAEAAEH